MDGKIKMPEEMARQLSQNIYAMQYFNSLSQKEKKEFISSCRDLKNVCESIIAQNSLNS